MGFWRELIESALDRETLLEEREQVEWIARDPTNAQPYYNLAQLRRMQWKQEEGLALLLEAVRLRPSFAEAHLALTEVYAVIGDYRAAWKHARLAQANGRSSGVELLERYGISESAE
ncbi:MAG: hypothetical protein NZV14_10255 [Bryobacteraceae bacterium]|nr:hypothetical protein [Bryobacteraceae bacterium]MDW8378534.1 hypothetical protein [Bryobacterales bacterium]